MDTVKKQYSSGYQTWPGEVKEIMVNMAFNLGYSGLASFRKLRTAIHNKNWNEAAREIVNSTWYCQEMCRAVRLVIRMRNVANDEHDVSSCCFTEGDETCFDNKYKHWYEIESGKTCPERKEKIIV